VEKRSYVLGMCLVEKMGLIMFMKARITGVIEHNQIKSAEVELLPNKQVTFWELLGAGIELPFYQKNKGVFKKNVWSKDELANEITFLKKVGFDFDNEFVVTHKNELLAEMV